MSFVTLWFRGNSDFEKGGRPVCWWRFAALPKSEQEVVLAQVEAAVDAAGKAV